MQFNPVERNRDITGYNRERKKGQGFYIVSVGSIRFIDFAGSRSQATVSVRDFDIDRKILLPEEIETDLRLDQPYQINEDPIFLKLVYIGRATRVRFHFNAPQEIRIERND